MTALIIGLSIGLATIFYVIYLLKKFDKEEACR